MVVKDSAGVKELSTDLAISYGAGCQRKKVRGLNIGW